MQGNRKRDTRPEVALRSFLHRLGFRYRVAVRPLALNKHRCGTADLVFPSAKVAVYVDGCFWHGCPEHFNLPRTNRAYWLPKIERNIARDSMVNTALSSAGWSFVRIWEHEPVEVAARRVIFALTEPSR